jgi:hypothetical protein
MSAKRAQRPGFVPQLLSAPSYPYQYNLTLPAKGAPNLADSQTCVYHHWLPTVARTTCYNTVPSPVATHFPLRTARGRSLHLSTRRTMLWCNAMAELNLKVCVGPRDTDDEIRFCSTIVTPLLLQGFVPALVNPEEL